jgi:hypothetical protein
MSQSADDPTRSELRTIRGHYRRRVWCRNADGFPSALAGNAPRFSRPPPLGAVLMPQQPAPATARTSPAPGGDALPPCEDPD